MMKIFLEIPGKEEEEDPLANLQTVLIKRMMDFQNRLENQMKLGKGVTKKLMEEWRERFCLPYKKALKILSMEESCHIPPKEIPRPLVPAIPCFMVSSFSKVLDVNNEDEYPPLTPYTSNHGVSFPTLYKAKTNETRWFF